MAPGAGRAAAKNCAERRRKNEKRDVSSRGRRRDGRILEQSSGYGVHAGLNKTNGRAIYTAVKATTATAKGAATREMIVERAYAIACRQGLEGLSIGELASEVGMSKSGVFAHFGSREDLQLSVLDWTAERFAGSVLRPALAHPRGLARLRAIMAGWFGWVRDNPDGCLILGAAFEYDSCPGALHDRITGWLAGWRQALARAVEMAVDSGELPSATDPALLSFELFTLVQGFHHARLYDPANADTLAQRSLARLLGDAAPPSSAP